MFRPAALLSLLLAFALGWGAAGAQAAPYSTHSMVQSCCTPFAQKKTLFAEASAMGARYVRLDVSLEGTFDY